jgi:hypothetical protein
MPKKKRMKERMKKTPAGAARRKGKVGVGPKATKRKTAPATRPSPAEAAREWWGAHATAKDYVVI